MTSARRPRDLVQPFVVEALGLRGRLVRLDDAIDEILGRHDYPPAVSHLLGEVVTLAAVLASALKVDGIFTLQIKGDGPVKTLVADLESPGTLRGYARYEPVAAALRETAPLGDVVGRGYLAWTVDPKAGERHQGIVALEGRTVAECTESYFHQSEQLRAAIRVGIGHQTEGGSQRWRSGAMMIQRIAAAGGINAESNAELIEEHWRHGRALTATLTPAELIDPALSEEALLYRLFHEVGVAVAEPQALKAGCRCSESRVRTVLSRFSPDEIRDMVVADAIEARCEFCNSVYRFRPHEFVAMPVVH
ncbi:MAG: molecular chaperone Hsp33 [Alphaproteobacteria bacterium]|nr:molecular chaperone Hsp33 [Alphaproteobacteria bacterium]